MEEFYDSMNGDDEHGIGETHGREQGFAEEEYGGLEKIFQEGEGNIERYEDDGAVDEKDSGVGGGEKIRGGDRIRVRVGGQGDGVREEG